MGEANDTDDDDDVSEELGNLTLLLREPGSLDYLKSDEYEHNLQAFNLYSSKEANVLEEIDSINIRRSMPVFLIIKSFSYPYPHQCF